MVEFYSEIIVRAVVFFYALWIGGVATTIYDRIPNDIPIGPTHRPKCNYCNQEIRPKYFFPIIGYFLSGRKCVHCGTKIPVIYLIIELSILAYIMLLSMTFSVFNEKFISKSLYGSFLIVLAFIYKTNKQLKIRLVWMLVAFILAYRGYNNTLPDIVDLFVSCVIVYIIFFLLKKDIQITDQEYKICVILIASFGIVASYIFALIFLTYKVVGSLPLLNKYIKKYKIDSSSIVIATIFTGIALSFF